MENIPHVSYIKNHLKYVLLLIGFFTKLDFINTFLKLITDDLNYNIYFLNVLKLVVFMETCIYTKNLSCMACLGFTGSWGIGRAVLV